MFFNHNFDLVFMFFSRFQLNYNRLEQEYKVAAMGMIKRQHKRGVSK